jgi:hypothetical protein
VPIYAYQLVLVIGLTALLGSDSIPAYFRKRLASWHSDISPLRAEEIPGNCKIVLRISVLFGGRRWRGDALQTGLSRP